MDKKDLIVTEPGAANDNNLKSKNNENETSGTNNDDNAITGVTGNEIKFEGKKEKKDGGNKMEDNPNGKKENDERQSSTTLANIPEVGKTHASGNIILNEGTEQLDGNSNMREELIRKIGELENRKKSLKQRQLIKEIETLQKEVQTNYEDETKGPDKSFKASDEPVIPNSVVPMATEIENQARIDMQLKELNQKIEKASKHINERKKQEDLSSFSADELQTKVQELKRRKELLSKFKQKEQVITLIQDLHKQVSTMKKNVKSKEDKIISSDLLKVFTLSPSEVDVYWDPSDFIDVKYYILFHREHSEDDDTVFQTIRPDATLSSYVIENLKPNTLYDFKFEAMANEGYRIITEASQIKTCKPVTGFALMLANHSGFKLSHLKNLQDIKTNINICREILEPFDFELVIEENLTGDQLLKSVEKHSVNLERQDIDCFICIVTGYMHNGHMYGIDGVPVMLHKMFEPLRITDKRDHEQPSVGEDKVKIIFVDAFKVREKIVEELDDSFQPREVQFRSSSNKTIEASWKRPKLSKRKLKGFKLLLKNTDTSQLQSIPFNKQKDSYFFKFTKLVPNIEYNLEISAEYDDSGVGKPVKATLTTFEPKFMQPRKLSVEAVSTSQIYVYWIPPVITSRTILGYKVSIRDQTHEEYSQKITSYTCIIFNDLFEDIEYNISVTTIVKGEITDSETEAKDEDSMPVYIDITTLTDRTASIMSGPTVNFVLEEPDFYIAYATASITSDSSNSSNSSFLDTLMRHLRSKYEKKDLQSILEDVKREIMCFPDNYETPQSLTTLRQPVFFGHQMSISEQ